MIICDENLLCEACRHRLEITKFSEEGRKFQKQILEKIITDPAVIYQIIQDDEAGQYGSY